MINLGSLGITDIKIGTSSVLSGYVGTSLVYPLYTPANSIWGTTSNNYISINVQTSDDLVMEWSGQFTAFYNNIIFGWTGSTTSERWSLYFPSTASTNSYRFRIGESQITTASSNLPTGVTMVLELGNNYIRKDGVDLVTGATSTISASRPFLLNTRSTKTTGLKLYKGGTLVFDGKPAVRNIDGVAGLLDSVSGNFYTNGTVYYD